MWGCKALESAIPEPEVGWNKLELPQCYEWRLNMQTGEVKEKYLCAQQHAMDFPVINAHFTGIKNRFGYAQVVDPTATSLAGIILFLHLILKSIIAPLIPVMLVNCD